MRNALELYYLNTGSLLGTDGWIVPEPSGTMHTLVESKYLPVLPQDPKGTGFFRYQYWSKANIGNGCPMGQANTYGFYAKLENPSSSDPNFISTTVGDPVDQCIATQWQMNYKLGNN